MAKPVDTLRVAINKAGKGQEDEVCPLSFA